eukprot:6459925-Amphidinium_carterae.1
MSVESTKRKAEEQLVPEQSVLALIKELEGVTHATDEDVQWLRTVSLDHKAEEGSLDWHVDSELPVCEPFAEAVESDDLYVGMHLDGHVLTTEDIELIRADERRELDNMEKMGVILFKPLAEIDDSYRKLSTRWVRQKRTETKWRARVVAKDFKFLDPHMDHLHTSGANQVTSRLLDYVAIANGYKRLIGDTTNAYFHTPQTKKLYLSWWPELEQRAREQSISPETHVPVLGRKLYGERDASVEFGNLFSSILEGAGLARCDLQPQFYRKGSLLVELHQDDLHIVGPEEEILEVTREVDKHLTMKWSKPLCAGDRYSFLKTQRVLFEDSVFISGNGKYITDIMSHLQLTSASVSPTPISKARVPDDDGEEIDEERRSCFRHCVSVARYLRNFRPDINFTVKELSHALQSPREGDWLRLKRLGRYLAGSRNLGLVFKPESRGALTGDVENMLMVWTDSDWATDKESRKSTSSYIVAFRNCVLHDLSRQQSVIAQSSGEAEVYAAASGVSCAMLIYRVMVWMGISVHHEIGLAMDSSTGKAVISRLGVGSIRHLEVKSLWLQMLHKQRQLRVLKVPGELNVADVGTKVLQPGRFQMLRSMLMLRTLDVSGWVEREPEKSQKAVRTVSSASRGEKVTTALIVAAEVFLQHVKGDATEECVSPSPGVAEDNIWVIEVSVKTVWQSIVCVACLVMIVVLGIKHACKSTLKETRSIGVQSQCTYRRDLSSPRFAVIPEHLR